MLAGLPVVRSSCARALFIGTVLVTVALLCWSRGFAATDGAARLATVFVYLFTALDYPAALCALLIVLVAACVPQKYSFRPLLCWIGHHVWLVAGMVCVALCIGTHVFYLDYPLTADEYAPYFQSQVFAAGHLAGQFPPWLVDWLIPAIYQNQFFFVSHSSGRIACAYWPSFALLLTPFTFLGVPWACNPVISALTLPAIHRLALSCMVTSHSCMANGSLIRVVSCMIMLYAPQYILSCNALNLETSYYHAFHSEKRKIKLWYLQRCRR